MGKYVAETYGGDNIESEIKEFDNLKEAIEYVEAGSLRKVD